MNEILCINCLNRFISYWQRPLQNSPKSPKCLGGNLGDFGEFRKGLNPLKLGFFL